MARHPSAVDPASDTAPAGRLEVSFVTSAPDPERCPPPAGPEVAVAGRSNAGKSSVLNRLTGSRQTAKVSKTPGRTQLLNFFDVHRVNGAPCLGRLVDLPGYGYAKANRAAQARWQAAVNRFLSERLSLRALVLVMDIRHPLQAFDVELIEWAAASHLPLLVLLNKADKLKFGAQQRTRNQVIRALEAIPDARVETFSATRGQNTAAVLQCLHEWLCDPERPQ
ncbi:MAG: ribosome biogenesis GTP-binding protein YihA/YsxC [Pseudomonadota bacterium]